MENMTRKIHDLEEELNKKQSSIILVHQTYQDIIKETSKVHDYVASLLKTYDFDKHSEKIRKEVYGSEQPKDIASKNEPQADAVENEPEDELVEKPDLDMFQDGSKFQRCLSSLLTTLTNSCNFVEDLERIRKEANETNQQHIQSIKDDYELKIEKMNKSSCDEKLDQLNQMFALKEKIIEQLEFELNELKTEEEKLRKLNSENELETNELRKELVEKEAQIADLNEKLKSKEKELFEKDRRVTDLEKELVDLRRSITSNSISDRTVIVAKNPQVVIPRISSIVNNSYKGIENHGKKINEMSSNDSSLATSSSDSTTFSPVLVHRSSSDDTYVDGSIAKSGSNAVSSDEDPSDNSTDDDSDSASNSSQVQKKENVDLNKINLNHRNFLNYSFPRVIFSAKKNSLNDDSAKPVGSCPAACKSCHLPVKTQRDDGRPFSCTFCNKKYKSKNTLRIHQLVHAEKLHHCSLCPKSFYRKDHLAQHKAVHSNLKPFRCEICEKHFKHRNSLRAHQLVHSDDKPYQCPICFKSFRCGKSVERHEIAHARVRRFF